MTFYDEYGNELTFYDENGVAITLEAYDTPTVIEALTAQTEKLETLVESQAEVISQLEAENTILIEMNTYCAYIFALVAAFLVYKIISAALSAMFGGG